MTTLQSTTNQRDSILNQQLHSHLEEKQQPQQSMHHSHSKEKQQQQQSQHPLATYNLISSDLTIDKKYLQETKEIYVKQCPSLALIDSKQQQSMFQLLSIGRMKKYPLLSYLIDSFLIDKLQSMLMDERIWCEESKTINRLTLHMPKLRDIIKHAMSTYFKRYCTPIMLPTPYKIHDSIQSVTHCLHKIGELITEITCSKQVLPTQIKYCKQELPKQVLPFQIELIIIPRHVADTTNQCENESELEIEGEFSESDTDSDDESDGDDEKGPNQTPMITARAAEISNIEFELKNNCVSYEHNTKTITETEFVSLYKKHCANANSTGEKEDRGRGIDSNICDHDDIHAFPHKKRLCIIVDRRVPNDEINNDNEKNNEIYLYEPPIFNEMPSSYVREWYMESSYKCIIPRKNNNITSKTTLGGWINVFSFHIEQEDEIKCYFYRDGQMVRFMADDIKYLFTHLFDLNRFHNKTYVNNKEIDRDIGIMRNTLKDIHFDKFRQIYG